MTDEEITAQLETIAGNEDFATASEELTDQWQIAKVGVEAVRPILRFMENHASIDYGMPGALVHFVERFHEKYYENDLIESISRKPTPITVWMLNRLINAADLHITKERLVRVLEQARRNPSADPNTIQYINNFLNEDHQLPP